MAAGIKISDLPSTNVLLETDQLMLSRGDFAWKISGNFFQTAYITQLSAAAFTAINSLSGQVFDTIFSSLNSLSATVSANISSVSTNITTLSTEVRNKTRWIDFKC